MYSARGATKKHTQTLHSSGSKANGFFTPQTYFTFTHYINYNILLCTYTRVRNNLVRKVELLLV